MSDWQVVIQRPGFTAYERDCVVGSPQARYEANYDRIFGKTVANDASESPEPRESISHTTRERRQ